MSAISNPICNDDQRRLLVRQRGVNGLDYVDVAVDRVTLTLYFFGAAPSEIALANLSIEGGVRVEPKIVDLRLCSADDPDRVNCVIVTVDQPGDDSTYRLRASGLENFDPRYSAVDFSFALDCPSDLDCARTPQAEWQPRPEPEINYLTKDYSSFRQLILDRLALNLPNWQEQHAPDFGIALVELMAYAADYLSYYQDAVGTEAYLNTARQRISIRRHLRLIDYKLGEGCNARAWISIEIDGDAVLDSADILFATGTPILGPPVAQLHNLLAAGVSNYEYFEPVHSGPVNLYQAHNLITIYNWGNQSCSLPEGATSATLLDQLTDPKEPGGPAGDRALRHLRPGMFLLFEETVNPVTSSPHDADPAHRHIVRLERVETAEDKLLGKPLVNIEWSAEDALPFALVYVAVVPPTSDDVKAFHAPAGECIAKATAVARGNLIFVDHGRTIANEPLGPVPLPATEKANCRNGRLTMRTLPGPPWRPMLTTGPITFRSVPSLKKPAVEMLAQDGEKAMPVVTLTDNDGSTWTALPDLLGSDGAARSFVAEIDEGGFAHLRFGDGVNGMAPAPGDQFAATYRVGNGIAGNVGAEVIGTLVFRGQPLDGLGISAVRNPIAASGGADPEPASIACLAGPYALKNELERAVTAQDYATLAERNTRVQRAAATLRWTGHRYMVRVAIDVFGTEDPSNRLLREIETDLQQYRRIGHDIEVVPAIYVPLDLEMTICVKQDWLRGHVELALLDLLSNRALPDGKLGLFHPDRLTFGQSIYASQLISAVMAVDGVETVKITRLARMFVPPVLQEEQGVLHIGPLEIPQLDNAQTVENGLLTLNMVGGR